jgi:hypothetical protein
MTMILSVRVRMGARALLTEQVCNNERHLRDEIFGGNRASSQRQRARV